MILPLCLFKPRHVRAVGAWPILLPLAKAERLQSRYKLGNVRLLGARQVAARVVAMMFGDVTAAEDGLQRNGMLGRGVHGNSPIG
jgi:hypothetical protein